MMHLLHLLYELLRAVVGELDHTKLHGKVNVVHLHDTLFFFFLLQRVIEQPSGYFRAYFLNFWAGKLVQDFCFL